MEHMPLRFKVIFFKLMHINCVIMLTHMYKTSDKNYLDDIIM